MQSQVDRRLVAVDIGNSRMKLGLFEHGGRSALPEPTVMLDLPIVHKTGAFDAEHLKSWCDERSANGSDWLVASVHRGAAERLISAVRGWNKEPGSRAAIWQLTYRDVPLEIRVDEPARVGIDRLLAAFAADRLRRRDRAAVIVDLGTATTVDLLEADGAFCGGAILPGIAMAARALDEQTDALPRIGLDHLDVPPAALGKSTVAAIEAGLYWGTIGAIRELIAQLSAGHAAAPDVFVTGGASPHIARLLAQGGLLTVQHVPHLVLAGIALVDQNSAKKVLE